MPKDAQEKLGTIAAGPRILVAKTARRSAIEKLDERARFNIVFFSTEVRPWRDVARHRGRPRDAAMGAIDAAYADGETNIFGALKAAVGLHEKSTMAADLEPVPDTIYFLTDGTPSRGEITDTETILSWMRDMNRFAKVELHVIAMGSLGARPQVPRAASPRRTTASSSTSPTGSGEARRRPRRRPPARAPDRAVRGSHRCAGPRAGRTGRDRCGTGAGSPGRTRAGGAAETGRRFGFRGVAPSSGSLWDALCPPRSPRRARRSRRRARRTPPRRARTAPVRSPRLFPTLWFAGIHLACFAAFFVGFSWTALAVCVGLYVLRMFAITAGYHRYFSHRAYDTSRPFAFLLGSVGAMAFQKGPIWWASVHRLHHRASDGPEDVHSPLKRGFWWAHIGWILASEPQRHRRGARPRLGRVPEIRLLDRFHWVAAGAARRGAVLRRRPSAARPVARDVGPQLLVWGMAISTVLALPRLVVRELGAPPVGQAPLRDAGREPQQRLGGRLTFGEGWHNNHHRFQAREKQGFFWWQIDVSHMVLWLFSRVGLVWDLKRPPPAILEEGATTCRGRAARKASRPRP